MFRNLDVMLRRAARTYPDFKSRLKEKNLTVQFKLADNRIGRFFTLNVERNPQNRGISGYKRISWDEALDIVAGEIKRVKKEHGRKFVPGAN